MLSLPMIIDSIQWVIEMELDYKRIGERIAKRRRQMVIKQNVLAELVGISNNYLSGIECGKEKPSLEVLIRLCNALQVTPDYLLMGNMYSNNVPQNIVDGLRLCSEEELSLIQVLVHHMIQGHTQKWNSDNFA